MTTTNEIACEGERDGTEFKPQYDPIGRFLKIQEVCVETGLSRATIYRCIQNKNNPFPKPVKVGNASRWAMCEVIEWKKRVLKQRDHSRVDCA